MWWNLSTSKKAIAWEKLEETEKALHEFKQQSSIVTSETGMDVSILKKLNELEGQLTEIQTQRELAEPPFALTTRDCRI